MRPGELELACRSPTMLTHILAWLMLALVGMTSAGASERGKPDSDTVLVCAETRGFHDGDTFACLPEGQASDTSVVVVRLAGLDAPETGQAHWRPARDRLRQLAGSGTKVLCYKHDRYARNVCRVRSSDERDIVEVLLREGWAWHSVAYLTEQSPIERSRYADAERAARADRAGLWTELEPQAPWDCRRSKERRQRCR